MEVRSVSRCEAALVSMMRNNSRSNVPSFRMQVFSRLAPFDCFWAGVSPILAFLIRDGAINRTDSVAVYCAIALAVSLIAFQWFKISSPISEFFSFHDAFVVAKACLTTVSLTAVILFVFTRLDDAPAAPGLRRAIRPFAGRACFRHAPHLPASARATTLVRSAPSPGRRCG